MITMAKLFSDLGNVTRQYMLACEWDIRTSASDWKTCESQVKCQHPHPVCINELSSERKTCMSKLILLEKKIGSLLGSLQLCPLAVSTRCGYNYMETNCILKV